MTRIRHIQQAPLLGDFMRNLQHEEDALSRFEVAAYDLKLYRNETLGVDAKTLNGRFSVSDDALQDLARWAEVPFPYFRDCDPKLRSISFNHRIRHKVPSKKPLLLVLRGQLVDRILNGNLLSAPRSPVLDTVSNARPKNVSKDDLKVITYDWNGEFDISIIAPALQREPRKDDLVAFGVNVSEGRDGAIQVQGAAFRLWCSNGSVDRICDSRQHRIRRPANRPDREGEFLSQVSRFAREAWNQWSHHAEELVKLNNILLDDDYPTTLRSRLRQAPFFLSLGVVNQILERLKIEAAQHEGHPTLYDLWNTMSFLGTHRRGLSHTYRRRLRYGAGELTRHEPRVCGACRQLLLS